MSGEIIQRHDLVFTFFCLCVLQIKCPNTQNYDWSSAKPNITRKNLAGNDAAAASRSAYSPRHLINNLSTLNSFFGTSEKDKASTKLSRPGVEMSQIPNKYGSPRGPKDSLGTSTLIEFIHQQEGQAFFAFDGESQFINITKYTYIYIYIQVCVCVCVYVCLYVCMDG